MMNEYFKLPLKLWESCDIKVFDADGNMAFDFPMYWYQPDKYINISKKKVVQQMLKY